MKSTQRVFLLLGLVCIAILCSAIVYIDTTQNYWRVGGLGNGYVQLIVSNKIVISVSTNTGRIGINSTNEDTFSVNMIGLVPETNVTGNGSSAITSGRISIQGAKGGGTFATTTATGGQGGRVADLSGAGGDVPLAMTNATGGIGGDVIITAGQGGMQGVIGVATNAVTGGAGGDFTLTSGVGASPAPASNPTNTVGGAGGGFSLIASAGGTPTTGWARKGGLGGSMSASAGNGGNSVRTNSGAAGGLFFSAGNSGNVSTTPGNSGAAGVVSFTAGNSGTAVAGGTPSPGGAITLTAGNGSTGDTNSDGGHVFIAGGAPGSGAVPGNVVLARTSAGTSRGAGVQIGPLITGGSATITNVLGGFLALDFPSTAAGTVSDLPIAVTGVTSNNCAVSLSVPWQSTFGNGGVFSTFNSNDAVYVRFANNNLVAAIDPVPGDFTVVVFRIR